jgi:3-oxoacyl-[acyl-carrier-protein] synthase II
VTAARVGDVVITGLGAVTPVGNDVLSTWDALQAGRSGVREITSFDASALPTRIAGEVLGFDPLAVMDAKQARRSTRFAQLAVAAALEAVSDAGLDLPGAAGGLDLPAGDHGPDVGAGARALDFAAGAGHVPALRESTARSDTDARVAAAHLDQIAGRTGVVVNTAAGAFGETGDGAQRFAEFGWRGMHGDFVPAVIPNMAACQVAMRLGIHGPVTASALACASGNYALMEAARLIRAGEADVVLAGATDASVTPLMIGSLSMMGALSTRNDDPERASRPFDSDRDGFVYAEGAVMFVVESARHAAERGARSYARYLGGALTCDAHHVVAPHPGATYAAAAMRQALARAGIPPTDLDYVCAHGTSTRANDRSETAALRSVLGPHADSVAVSSPKSMTGHLIGAAGALSVLVGCLAIRDGVVPPTINLETADPECDLDYVPKVARQMTVNTVLTNAFGFGGQNCSVVLGRV